MRYQYVKYAITLFAGYLQRLFSEASGVLLIDNFIRQIVNGRSDVRVTLCPWNANESDVAESLWRLKPPDEPQVHVVIGYSYGGDRAVKFCRELVERGDCVIAVLILIDPVVRWDWLPGVAASLGIGELVVPAEVDSVEVFAQSSPRWKWKHGRDLFEPAAHPVLWRREFVTPLSLVSSHSYIDNAAVVREACVGAVERVVIQEQE